MILRIYERCCPLFPDVLPCFSTRVSFLFPFRLKFFYVHYDMVLSIVLSLSVLIFTALDISCLQSRFTNNERNMMNQAEERGIIIHATGPCEQIKFNLERVSPGPLYHIGSMRLWDR